ncbi:cytochrome P450 [Nocardia sp. NPDC057227]|uniref:cytochrome P450 n=1 Tax=Nocardia sp. NPDC057227 TaxID=3346056 RepID=UPI00362F8FE2
MRRLDHIPGPSEHGPLGTLRAFSRDRETFVRETIRTHGDVCRLRFPLRDVVVFGHPDDAARYLNDTDGRYQKLGYQVPFRNRLGGLSFQEGEAFREKRSALVSMFGGGRLARTFAAVAEVYDTRLDTEIDQARGVDGTVDLQRVLHRLLLLGMIGAVFTEPLTPAEVRTVDQGVRLGTGAFGFLRLMAGPPNILRGPNRLPATALVQLYRVIGARVQARRARTEPRDDVLGALLAVRSRADQGLDDAAITNELVMLLSASYGSMTAALSQTFARVLMHPAALDRLRAEIVDCDTGDHAVESVRRLRWARACFEESLRLQSSPPLLRIAAADSTTAGFDIPRGTPLAFPLSTIHRDPRWWPDPEDFQPLRFYEPAPRGERPMLAYLTFGSGPHRCLGTQLAYLQAQYLLSVITRRYRLELPPGWMPTETPGLAPMIAGGLPVRFTPCHE